MKKTGQFKLKTANIEKIYSNLLSSRDLDSILPIDTDNYLKKIKGKFFSPIESIFIHLNTDHLNSQNASILGIIRQDLISFRNNVELKFNIPLDSLNGLNIKKYSNDCLIISNENDENEFTVRNIENFGISIFAGRPDLSNYKAFSPYLRLNGFENFQKKIIKFANIVELMVNGIYKENNVNLVENTEYELNNE